jgi:hypothetical protein
MDMFELADQLDQRMSSSPRMPLANRVLVREQDLVALLARMRAAVPAEAQEAHRQREEYQRIIMRGQADADSIIGRAQDEVERLVHHPHLLNDARERAAEVLREAEVKAELVRSSADTFVTTTLETLYHQLSDLEVQIARNSLAIQGGITALAERVIPAASRGEVPPGADDSAFLPSGDVRGEHHMDPKLSAPNPGPTNAASSPAPDSPLA